MLPFKPLYSVNTYLEAGVVKFKFFINALFQGRVYRDRYNQIENSIPNRFRMDTGFIYDFYDFSNFFNFTSNSNFWGSSVSNKQPKYSIIFKIRNIFNSYQNDVLDYPLPGRYFEIQLKGSF